MEEKLFAPMISSLVNSFFKIKRARDFALLIFLLLISVPQISMAGRFSAGILIGNPSALSAKYWVETEKALDFGIGWDGNSNLYLLSDYLFHFPSGLSKLNIPAKVWPYVGVGGYIKFYNDNVTKHNDNSDNSIRLVFRIPVGLEWMAAKFPVSIFGEIVPGLRVYPNTTSDFGAGIGVRINF